MQELPRRAYVSAAKSSEQAAQLQRLQSTPEQLVSAQAASSNSAEGRQGEHVQAPLDPVVTLKFPKYNWPNDKRRTHVELRNTHLMYKPPDAADFAGAFDLREVLRVEHLPADGKVLLTFKGGSGGGKKPGPVELSVSDPRQLRAWYKSVHARWEYVWTCLGEVADRWSPRK